MRFAPDDNGGTYAIQGYDETGVVIRGQRHTSALLVCPDRLDVPWGPVADPTALAPEQLAELVALAPQVLLLGTGRRALLPRPALMLPFTQSGIGVEIMTTVAACRTYNLLLAEGRRVVAVLMPPDFEAAATRPIT
jgi:uncharacterized protein